MKNKIIMDPQSTRPFTCSDLSAKKNLNIYTDKNKKSVELNDIKVLGEIASSKSKIIIETIANKYYKEIVLKYPEQITAAVNVKPISVFQAFLTKKFTVQFLMISINIKSISVAVIDSEPKEVKPFLLTL